MFFGLVFSKQPASHACAGTDGNDTVGLVDCLLNTRPKNITFILAIMLVLHRKISKVKQNHNLNE
jgi:hypothetical protein